MFLILPKVFGKNIGERKVLIGVILASIVYAMLSIHTNILYAGIVVLVFTMIAETIKWWTSIYVNKHVSSAHRATALSSWAMLQKVPYILLVGMMTNLAGQAFSTFILVSGVIAGLFAIGTLILLPKIDPTLKTK